MFPFFNVQGLQVNEEDLQLDMLEPLQEVKLLGPPDSRA